METEYRKLQEEINTVFNKIKEFLMSKYENLYFYITPSGKLTVWVRNKEGKDGAGINTKFEMNVCEMFHLHWEYLESLNKEIESVHKEPDKYFYCTECGKVKEIKEFADSVLAGYYCKECAEKPAVAALIAESKKAGFYD